jgi:hypothetical protein
VFLGGYFRYAFLHVSQSILLRGYTGVVTVVGIVVFGSVVLHSELFRVGILDDRLAVLTALAGIVVFFRSFWAHVGSQVSAAISENRMRGQVLICRERLSDIM